MTHNAENDAPRVRVCTDCKHEHVYAPHGFCGCGCTYPGWEWDPDDPPPTRDEDPMWGRDIPSEVSAS